jgi:hypothetical protein
LLHEDPSAHKPWTKTIFGVAVVAFALVVVVVVAVVVLVAFVAVAMPSEASGSIKVLLLFSMLAKPEYGVKVKLAISIVVKNSKSTKLILSSYFLDMYLRKGLQCLFKDDAENI